MVEPNNPQQQPASDEGAGSLHQSDKQQPQDEAEAKRVALAAKKRRTLINWMRVIALLFAGFFFLSQCGMSKHQAIAKIVESCIQNVPVATKWQQDLQQRGLQDADGRLVAQYCVCMWKEPLERLGVKQIQSFAKISSEERLRLLGGEAAFVARDKQCVANLHNN